MKITHDIHTHTVFSSCCPDPTATVGAYIEKAKESGLRTIGISNHTWDEKVPGASTWYKGQPVGYVLEEKKAIPADTGGVRVLFGCETEYCGMTDTLGMLPETAKNFDYILIPHTHTHNKNFVIPENPFISAARKELTEKLKNAFPEFSHELAARMVGRISYAEMKGFVTAPEFDDKRFVADFLFDSFEKMLSNPGFIEISKTVPTVIAHPFSPCGETKEDYGAILDMLSRERLFDDFSRCAAMGIPLDVNIDTYYDIDDFDGDPMVKVMRVAKDAGCLFTFGTDAHTLRSLESIRRAGAIADAIGLTESDIAAFAG